MKRTPIQLSDHFTTGKLLRFVLPSIAMMVFTSIYGVVDGACVSIFAGKTSFAAINLIYPILCLFSCPAFMLGTGGSALVGRMMGEGEKEKGQSVFSLILYATAALSIVLAAVGLLLVRPISISLGAEGKMLEDSVRYGGILIFTQILFMLQIVLQFFLVMAEKPMLNLVFCVISGVTNIVLDLIFVGRLGWGIDGAAFATASSQLVGCVLPLVYFACPNTSLLRLRKPRFDLAALVKTCSNGLSELMSNLSCSVVTVLYNWQLMKLAGEDGIAAYGAIMYVSFFILAVLIGYTYGSSPLFSYHLGAENFTELKNLFHKSMTLMTIGGVLLTITAEIASGALASFFVGYDAALTAMTRRGFRIYSLSFLLSGFSIFGSGFFTALNNGKVSALISFMRTFVFQIAAVLILPFFWKLDGVWFAIVAAELCSVLVTFAFFICKRRSYHY